MFKKIIILIMAVLAASISHPHSVFADDTSGTPESSRNEMQKPSDYEDWYKPDNAYPTDDQQTTNTNLGPNAGGGGDEPRVAPLEDKRPKDQ